MLEKVEEDKEIYSDEEEGGAEPMKNKTIIN